eukprot:750249-Hanusia_phi.AAC.3
MKQSTFSRRHHPLPPRVSSFHPPFLLLIPGLLVPPHPHRSSKDLSRDNRSAILSRSPQDACPAEVRAVRQAVESGLLTCSPVICITSCPLSGHLRAAMRSSCNFLLTFLKRKCARAMCSICLVPSSSGKGKGTGRTREGKGRGRVGEGTWRRGRGGRRGDKARGRQER